MRLFVGIPLVAASVRELAAIVEHLREPTQGPDGLRWTEPESWHITLQFLGATAQKQLECLKAHLSEVRCEPVPIQLGGLACFERAGALFADVAVTPELAALQQRVVAATARCGFAAEERPYHPHITLARSKGRDRGSDLQEVLKNSGNLPPFPQFTARECALYESRTDPEGARYEVRMRFELRVRPTASALKQDRRELKSKESSSEKILPDNATN